MDASEQQFHDLEQRYVSLRTEYEALCLEKEAFNGSHHALTFHSRSNIFKILFHNRQTGKTENLQSSISDATARLNEAEMKISENDTELKKRTTAIKEANISIEDGADRLRRRTEECERLRADLSSQSDELVAMQGRLKDAQLSSSEMQSQQLPKEYLMAKLQHDNATFASKITALEKELESRDSERTRDESIAKVSELTFALNEANMKLEANEKTIAALNVSEANYLL